MPGGGRGTKGATENVHSFVTFFSMDSFRTVCVGLSSFPPMSNLLFSENSWNYWGQTDSTQLWNKGPWDMLGRTFDSRPLSPFYWDKNLRDMSSVQKYDNASSYLSPIWLKAPFTAHNVNSIFGLWNGFVFLSPISGLQNSAKKQNVES